MNVAVTINGVSRFIKGEAVEPIPLINNMRGEKKDAQKRENYTWK